MGENIKKKKKRGGGGKVVSHFDPHSIPVGGGNTLFVVCQPPIHFKKKKIKTRKRFLLNKFICTLSVDIKSLR